LITITLSVRRVDLHCFIVAQNMRRGGKAEGRRGIKTSAPLSEFFDWGFYIYTSSSSIVPVIDEAKTIFCSTFSKVSFLYPFPW